jgi:hypothetical protein
MVLPKATPPTAASAHTTGSTTERAQCARFGAFASARAATTRCWGDEAAEGVTSGKANSERIDASIVGAVVGAVAGAAASVSALGGATDAGRADIRAWGSAEGGGDAEGVDAEAGAAGAVDTWAGGGGVETRGFAGGSALGSAWTEARSCSRAGATGSWCSVGASVFAAIWAALSSIESSVGRALSTSSGLVSRPGSKPSESELGGADSPEAPDVLTGGSETAGSETGGSETGGSETGGSESDCGDDSLDQRSPGGKASPQD